MSKSKFAFAYSVIWNAFQLGIGSFKKSLTCFLQKLQVMINTYDKPYSRQNNNKQQQQQKQKQKQNQIFL